MARVGLRPAGSVTPRFDVDKDGVSGLLIRGLDDAMYVKHWQTGQADPYPPDYDLPVLPDVWKDVIEPGDLVSADADGVLWRYDADGAGKLHAKVKVGQGWNTHKALY
ncbi:hypothetical protein [Streptomyces sennicomposti]